MFRGLIVANLAASAAHFAHNGIYFDGYGEPEWIPGGWFVVLVWLVIAPVLVLGYRWHVRGSRVQGLLAVG